MISQTQPGGAAIDGQVPTVLGPTVHQVPFVDLTRQTAALADELQAAFRATCERADFILGTAVDRFERSFAAYLGAAGAVGVASGLDALRLALAALEIGPGDEVVLPTNTFIATALAVSAVGARPVLVDCQADTMNLAPQQVAAAIGVRTRAILPVHLAGRPADMAALFEIAGRHGLVVIEDACQAHGARYQGQMCGTLGSAGCFSFYPGKNLGAFGDGGLVASSDQSLLNRIRRLRHYGQDVKYRHVERGGNSRLDTLQAAILELKLRRLDEWNAARVRHADAYRQRLAGLGDLVLPATAAPGEHVYHLFVIETAQRDELQRYLTAAGIQTGVHYPIPIHLQPAYADLGYRRGDFPVAERLADRMLSLPMFPELTVGEIDYVCERISAWFEHPR